MATGVKPRDEDPQMTRTDLENIQQAMKSKKFRDMFVEYFDEMRDPANQALYQKEMTQLEKERGYDVTWINPKGGYVIKTSVAGDRPAYINICSNENVTKPSCDFTEVNGEQGMNWSLPYTLLQPREDYNSKREKIVLYDVVFHPDTLRMAELNKRFRELLNKTAFEALAKTYDIHLDNNNSRFPNSEYKGFAVPGVFKMQDPHYKPPTDEEVEDLSPELIEKLYPQHSYSEPAAVAPGNVESNSTEDYKPVTHKEVKPATKQQRRKVRRTPEEFQHKTDNGYTIPKYVIKQQKNIDLQDFTYNKDCKLNTAIPSQIVVEVNLPLLTSTKDCSLDVQEKKLSLKSERPAKYKLNISLPYSVNDEMGNAKFDKSKHKLIVTLPVIRNNAVSNNSSSLSVKADSGVESEGNSGSQSDEENSRENNNMIVEISSTPATPVVQAPAHPPPKEELFFNPSLGYLLPTYTHNVMDDIVAFTFHVKNTEPDSVIVRKDGKKISMKFTSIGSSFVPVHYGAIIVFDEEVSFANVTGEAWDNNVILQMELAGEIPQKFQIGLSEDTLSSENFDVSHTKKIVKLNTEVEAPIHEDVSTPVVAVTNLGTETNIVVSSNAGELDEDDDDDMESSTAKEDDDDIVWTDPGPVTGAKSILRKPGMTRSFSESSVGDIASSMDYISSDCIPEESSLKKTVRFSDVIARQFYRYNSSIEGQKKKNQRKKSKKRSDRRKSESEAEDDLPNLSKISKHKLKSALKQRRDSGLADTSDAETEYRNVDVASSVESQKNDNEECKTPDETFSENNNEDKETSVFDIVNKNENNIGNTEPVIWESESEAKLSKGPGTEKSDPITCETIKHNTDFYDPEKLNKGQYLEVSFKNDLIFDLDM